MVNWNIGEKVNYINKPAVITGYGTVGDKLFLLWLKFAKTGREFLLRGKQLKNVEK